MAKVDLSNPKRREALPPRGAYYSHALGSKRYVLLRVGKRGASWGARVPGKTDFVIGNTDTMTFEEAAEIVRKASETNSARPEALHTIGEAIAFYVDHAAKTKSDASMSTIRMHARQIEPLENMRIADTPLSHLNRWKTALITDTRGPVGANKTIGTLKAALNMHGVDGPWRGLKKHKEPKKTVETRAAVMSPDQVKLMLRSATGDLQTFLTALWLAGARPSEIRDATKAALTGRSLTLTGKTGTRSITLTPKVAAWFQDRNDVCNTHLVEWNGRPIGTKTHEPQLKALVAALGDRVPANTTLYTFRHSYITAALYEAVPVFPLAKHCGTSVEMIERTYGHILADLQAKAFDALEGVLL